MNKEEIIYNLRVILRELTCMNDSHFEKLISENKFEGIFVRYGWGENGKITAKIHIEKSIVKIDDEE